MIYLKFLDENKVLMPRIVFLVLDFTSEASNNQYLGFEQTQEESLREKHEKT